MNDIVGFAEISKTATTCVAVCPKDFIGEICAVMEFDQTGGVLAINPKSTALAMIDKVDINRSFKCGGFINNVILPPNINTLEQMIYLSKIASRNGGYNNLLMNMVLQASLMKGVFTDGFLWMQDKCENQ